MKKLDWYILKQFILSLLVITVALGLTIIVINMVEQLRDFIDNNVPFLKIAEYYLYFAGWVLKSFTPMFVMLATMFAVSVLARRFEILAMKASGLSLYRIALPLIVAATVIAVAHFGYNEFVYPPANHKRIEMKEFTIEKKSKKVFASVHNVYRQLSPGHFYTMRKFNVDRAEGSNLKLYKTDGNHLKEIIIADKVSYRDHQWRAMSGLIRYFSDSAHESYVKFDTLVLSEIKDKPADLARRIEDPQDMGLLDLENYINLMKRTGGPYQRETVDLKIKYAFPLTSIVVILICVPFASNPRKGAVAIGFATGALIALLYFVLFRVLQSAGYNQKVPEVVAVWGVNVLFLAVGIMFMLKARK